MSVAFLAWRDPERRGWHSIGRLSYDGTFYEFVYTKGMEHASQVAGFRPLASFPESYVRYLSPELFALFSNRLPQTSRPDYAEFVQWLSAPETVYDPIALLALSGGRRVTDTLEVFPCPVRDSTGLFHIRFFVHGLRHLSAASIVRAEKLIVGERLLLQHDFQNPHDPYALMLRTSELSENDIYPIGFTPRYLLEDLHSLLRTGQSAPIVTVAKVNPSPAPVWFRVMCSLTAAWPANYQPFAGHAYQPIAESLTTRFVAPSAAISATIPQPS